MSFYVYVIYSQKLDRYYIGYTENLQVRISQHNAGISHFTAKAKDWVLVHSEVFHSRQEAGQRERAIKNMKSRKYIERLIKGSTWRLHAPKAFGEEVVPRPVGVRNIGPISSTKVQQTPYRCLFMSM